MLDGDRRTTSSSGSADRIYLSHERRRKPIRSDLAGRAPTASGARQGPAGGDPWTLNLGTALSSSPGATRAARVEALTRWCDAVEHASRRAALAARLTYSARRAMQAAVAAGRAGGSVFVGSTEAARSFCPKRLRGGMTRRNQRRQQGSRLGHPLHKPVDPRAVRLFESPETATREVCD